jgi:predicted MPP superfamily phosphohydrolase
LTQNTVDSSISAEASSVKPISRRRFLTTGLCGGAGLALYSGEIERHWIDITSHDIHLRSLPPAFEGMKIVQLSDIHLDEYTEPFLLRQAVAKINALNPDVIFLTGDYVSYEITPRKYSMKSAWHCAEILNELKCKQRYAILGNHDVMLGAKEVTQALVGNGMTVLNNSYLPLERGGSRIWLIGLDDPVCGQPDPDRGIPVSIRNVPDEPLIVLCHAPDYADTLLAHPAGKSIDFMLSGHTHGGQVRLPFVGAMTLPPEGRKYVQGWFKFGSMQLYVNRGIGTVGVPFRFACPPEITTFTLRAPRAQSAA